MKRRTLLTAMASVPLLTACYYPQYFDIGWDEEVQLHDGRVIVVKVKYTYERLSRLSKYERSILRNTEISFDLGEKMGRFNQLFKKHRVDAIEYYNGSWYLLLETRGGALYTKTETGWSEEWGEAQNSSGHKLWKLDAKGLVRASLHDLPDSVLKVNILMDYAPAAELVAFDGLLVTLVEKTKYAQKYPLDPPRLHIDRPKFIAP